MRSKLSATLLLISALCASNARAAVRIALVEAGGGKGASELMALTAAKLTQDNRIELLERGGIQKVLDEQKLSLAGLMNADQAVAAGKLLRVEVFAVLQSFGDETPPALAVFDAFNGSRLVDVDLPKENVETQVDAIATGIDRARSKLVAPIHAKTLCLLAVRNADLPRAMDSTCNAVGALLERQLLMSDDVRLLERKRLEGINRERELGTLDPKHDILASLVTVDLEFARVADGGKSTVTALLNDGGGKSIAKITTPLDQTNLPEAVNQLSARIADVLQVVPGQAGLEPEKECQRFMAEARFLLAHGQVPEAMQAAESAYALGSETRGCAKLLSFALMRQASDMVRHKQDMVAALDIAARAMDIRHAHLMNLRKANSRDDELALFPDNVTGNEIEQLLTAAINSKDDAPLQAAARRVGDSYIQFVRDWLISSESQRAGNAQLLAHHIEYIRLNHIVPAMALASTGRKQYVDEVCGAYERYFALLEQLKPETSLMLYVIAGKDLGDSAYWTMRERAWSPAEFAKEELPRIDALYQKLIKHPSPAVRFYGLRNRLQFLRAAGRLSDEQFAEAYIEARDAAQAALDDATLIKVDRAGIQRNLIIGNAMTIVGKGEDAQRWLDDRLSWYDFFISRGELPQAAIARVTDLQQMKATPEQTVQVLRDLEKLVESGSARLIECSRAEARTQLASKVRYLAGVYPEVRSAFMVVGDDTRQLLKVGGEIASIENVIADETGGAYVTVSTLEKGERAIRAMTLALDGTGGRTIGTLPGAAIVSDACLTKTWLAAATDQGVYLFARDGGPPSRITVDDGLPTNQVQTIAMLGDVIYAGLGDRGYLVSFDLNARACKVLASSRRKQKASPFDDAGSFSIVRIVADEAKQRILFVHCRSGRYEQNGLWQLDPATFIFDQLLKVYFDYSDRNAAASRLLPDGRLVVYSYNWAALFDARDDSASLLYSDVIGPGPDLRGKPISFKWNRLLDAPYTMVGDELWAGDPLSRVERNTSRVQAIDLPGRESARARPTTRSASRPAPTTARSRDVNNAGDNQCLWIEPLHDLKHVIAGNARVLWLVSTEKTSPTSQPATAPAK